MHIGNYSGCTKKIINLKNLKSTPPIFSFLHIIELGLCFTLIVAHMLPIFVVLPMGGGAISSTGESKSQSNSNTEKSATLTAINKSRKRTKSGINSDEEDDDRETKKPKKNG